MNPGDLVDGRYEVLAEVASGGMATVYAARVVGAEGFEKLVALKRMLPKVSENDAYRRMFLDEARVAAHIRSPYVVSTFDLGQEADGSLYIAMDLVVGASLATLLRQSYGRALPIPVVATIIEQAARGLNDAHVATTNLGEPLQIVHRDISPQNLLVGVDGATRVTDFGVAHAAKRLTKTVGAKVKGKLAYCSPEQASAQALDHRSDVFALGIVFWESLTLRRLFANDNPVELVTALLQERIPAPREARPEIPEALAAVVMKALERDLGARFSSALKMAEAIRHTGIGAGVNDVRALVQERAGASVDSLTEQIKWAVATSKVRPSTSPEPSPVGAKTLGTTTMLALQAPGSEMKSTVRLGRTPMAPTASLRARPRPGQQAPLVLPASAPSPAPSTTSSKEAAAPPKAPSPSTEVTPAAYDKRKLVLGVTMGVALGIMLGVGGAYLLRGSASAVVTPVPVQTRPAAPLGVAPGEGTRPESPGEGESGAGAPVEPPVGASPGTGGLEVDDKPDVKPEEPAGVEPADVEPSPMVRMRASGMRASRMGRSRRNNARTVCTNNCPAARDGVCDDGGPNTDSYASCNLGSDCHDCGPRRRPPPIGRCDDTCEHGHANNGHCGDGGPGTGHTFCALGTDCSDCGPR